METYETNGWRIHSPCDDGKAGRSTVKVEAVAAVWKVTFTHSFNHEQESTPWALLGREANAPELRKREKKKSGKGIRRRSSLFAWMGHPGSQKGGAPRSGGGRGRTSEPFNG